MLLVTKRDDGDVNVFVKGTLSCAEEKHISTEASQIVRQPARSHDTQNSLGLSLLSHGFGQAHSQFLRGLRSQLYMEQMGNFYTT